MSDKHEKKHKSDGPPHGGGHEEAHEGAPEWLISFADNVTLMMGFFVILFVLNMKPASAGGGNGGDPKSAGSASTLSPEMLDVAIAIREAFNNPVDPNSSSPIDLPLVRRLIERGESNALRDGPLGREHDVRSIRPTDYYSPAGAFEFDDHSSKISMSSRDDLDKITKLIRGYNLVIELRGHVSAAEANDAPDRGMSLSYDRALVVAEHFALQGIPWSHLRLVACGDGERLVQTTYDAEEHRRNQRVEVIVTEKVPIGIK